LQGETLASTLPIHTVPGLRAKNLSWPPHRNRFHPHKKSQFSIFGGNHYWRGLRWRSRSAIRYCRQSYRALPSCRDSCQRNRPVKQNLSPTIKMKPLIRKAVTS